MNYHLIWFLFLVACNSSSQKSPPIQTSTLTSSDTVNNVPTKKVPSIQKNNLAYVDSIFALNDTSWVNLSDLNTNIVMDLRYATTNNFMQTQIYDCPECYLRLGAAKALLKAQHVLEQQGLSLKMFDCYRPQSAQYKLWLVKPDARFVAPPSKGSMHSRGGAIDLTIINLNTQQELEMGTAYDYFGVEAYWSYTKHAQQILDNRQLLLRVMNEAGFKTVTTEWWHFSYRRAWFKLSDMVWDCE